MDEGCCAKARSAPGSQASVSSDRGIIRTRSGWNLKASNGETIATSEVYNSKAAAPHGIESVRKNAADAKVDDQTGG